jgi:hypothetical protein
MIFQNVGIGFIYNKIFSNSAIIGIRNRLKEIIYKDNTISSQLVDRCLTPTLTVFQPYRGVIPSWNFNNLEGILFARLNNFFV